MKRIPIATTTTKPASTSAATTAFCAERVGGPGGFLWIDGNGKITAGNGTLEEPKPNAFSLVQVEDCPGATSSCKTACYVHNLQEIRARYPRPLSPQLPGGARFRGRSA